MFDDFPPEQRRRSDLLEWYLKFNQLGISSGSRRTAKGKWSGLPGGCRTRDGVFGTEELADPFVPETEKIA